MAVAGDFSVQRRKLSIVLRNAREAAHLTQREAARHLDWSLSKMIRIEAGAQGVSVSDLKAMLDLYHVTDRELIASLMVAARGSRGQSWWNEYRDIVSPLFAQYLGHEGAASSFQIFHPLLVPGLLHTSAYAAALLGAHPEPERAQRIVKLRGERQDRLFAQTELNFHFVLDEESLHRWVGGPGVMRHQVQHLLDISARPNVSVQIVPFSAGAHPGLRGPFILLRLGETGEDLLFLESISGDQLIRDDPDQIAKYMSHFATLGELALPDEQGEALLKELAARYQQAEEAVADNGDK
jgi:transcriptional regulator with XRE-family HTH domain